MYFRKDVPVWVTPEEVVEESNKFERLELIYRSLLKLIEEAEDDLSVHRGYLLEQRRKKVPDRELLGYQRECVAGSEKTLNTLLALREVFVKKLTKGVKQYHNVRGYTGKFFWEDTFDKKLSESKECKVDE